MSISKGILTKEPNYVFYWLNFLRGLSYGLVAPIYTVFLFSFGLNAWQVSLTNLVFVLSIILLQLPAGALADAMGRKKATLLALIASSISFFIYSFGQNWITFMIAELFSGIGFVLMTGILEAWATDAWIKKTGFSGHGFLFSRADTANNFANMAGGLSGGLLGSLSLQLPFFIGGIIFIITAFIAYISMEETWINVAIKPGKIISQSWQTMKLGTKLSLSNKYIWRVALFSGMAMIGFKIMDIFWAKRFVDLAKGQVWVTGYVWFLATLFMIIGNQILKWWLDHKKDYLTGFIIIMAWAGINIFLLSMVKDFYLALIFFLFYEITRGIQRPALFGYLNKIIASQQRATMLSFMITISWVGGAIGLVILGWVAKRYSIEISWIIASIILLFSIVPILSLKKKQTS